MFMYTWIIKKTIKLSSLMTERNNNTCNKQTVFISTFDMLSLPCYRTFSSNNPKFIGQNVVHSIIKYTYQQSKLYNS